MNFDFSGWATKNDLKCKDGRTIRRDAFKVNDGKRVPLIWNHQHGDPSAVLGHAYLTNRDEGVWADCAFNKTQNGKDAYECVKHGDVEALSIHATDIIQEGGDVLHGVIREVSLVLAGANPGAFIESVFSHGYPIDESDEECVIYNNENVFISHSDKGEEKPENSKSTKKEEDSEVSKPEEKKGKTVAEVIDGMTEEQKDAVAILLAEATGGLDDEDDDEEGDDMSHNIFEGGRETGMNVLTHSEEVALIEAAKRTGSLREAVTEMFDGDITHAIPTTGMTVGTGTNTYGIKGTDQLFPDAQVIDGVPQFISRNMDWVQKVMGSVRRTPFSRVKSVYANITEDEARAKGYIKGKEKKDEVFTLLKRTTNPQTVYKKQKLDRDDIVDIKDLNVVQWIRQEMRMMLEEEIARAILIGDGRQSHEDDKIQEINIRPVYNDADLFTIKSLIKVTASTTGHEKAKLFIDECVRSRKKYKGSGNPTLYTTEDMLTEMLLLEDTIGHKLYKTIQELATALRVSEIVTVEPMEGLKLDTKEVAGIIVNLADYNVGADKGGETTMFDDFDIDFNQYKYLIETRFSGALIKPFSAITLAFDPS